MRRLTSIAFSLLSIAFAGLSVPGPAAAEDGHASLTVRVTGMEPEGALRIALFEGPDEYGQLSPGRAEAIPVDGPEASATFRDLPPGRYAILVHHDRNGDGKMDRALFGIPSEPTAASNGRKARFGVPDFDDVAFDIGEADLTQTIEF